MALAEPSGYTGRKAVLSRDRRSARCVLLRDFGSLTFDVPPLETSRWRAISRVLRSTMDSLSCALIPAACSLCESPLPRLSSVPICDACWVEVRSELESGCVRCGDALDFPAGSSGKGLCRTCRLVPPPFERAVAYGLYQGRMRDVIHAFKYERLHPAAKGMGLLLAEAIAQLAEDAPGEMLVVPVPLHRSKSKERGFNQARALADQALRCLRQLHPTWRLTLAPTTLLRLRATQSQAGLSPHARRANVMGAFSVADPAGVEGKHILLVDDILTTGATVRSATKALLKAGAATVWVATLARARRVHGHDSNFQQHSESPGGVKVTEQPEAGGGRARIDERERSSQYQPSF
jgi:ComF family protein